MTARNHPGFQLPAHFPSRSVRSRARCLVVLSATLFAWSGLQAAPTSMEILQFKPKQEGVSPSMPKSGEESTCKVELLKGQEKGSGWLLRDPAGLPMRRFYDTNDDNKSDVRSFYREGSEVYREIDSNFDGIPDQYRWFNAGGSRWGYDTNGDGVIDFWQVISPEEVSQELVRAVATKDAARFAALLVNENDLQQMKLAQDKVGLWKERIGGAMGRFNGVVGKLGAANPGWLHLELGVPQCMPAEQIGSRYDLIRHRRGTVLLDLAGKTDWLQTGELILVGTGWRLVDGPSIGALMEEDSTGNRTIGRLDFEKDPDLRKLIEDLGSIDRQMGMGTPTARQHLQRAEQLEKIASRIKPEERDPWLRQVADSLSSAAQGANGTGEPQAMPRLASLVEQMTKASPGSPLAGYVVFRQLQAEYSLRLAKPGEDFSKVQQDWIGKLTQFAEAYPTAEDTADALLQLGMVSEFMSKNADATKWYQQASRAFANKPQGLRAAGAIRRLESEGKPYALTAVSLENPTQSFDLGQVTGKVVVVYFWASWNNQTVGDFARLKLIAESYKDKGMVLVTVNCDQAAPEGIAVMRRTPIPGTHLHQPGGLEGKICVEQGLMVLPHLVVIAKDGKVAVGNAQLAILEDDVNKLTK